ncbi:MAG: hypothetical protein FWG68_07545 [Defluviitaleaceae bacterium]|nr:hypothetical protein [Defluviitaleaceae bacterium]
MQLIGYAGTPEWVDAAKKATTSNDIVADELHFRRQLEVLGEYLRRGEERGEKRGEKRGEERGEKRGKEQAREEMLLLALRNNAPQSLIDKMCETAGITKARLAKLIKQV